MACEAREPHTPVGLGPAKNPNKQQFSSSAKKALSFIWIFLRPRPAGIYGAKFQEQRFNIFRDIVYSVF